MKKYQRIVPFTISSSRAQKTKTRLMRRLILAVAILSFSALNIHVAGQGVRKPPVRVPKENVDYFVDLISAHTSRTGCILDSSGRLIVDVRNDGNDDAPQSHVSVVFEGQKALTFTKTVGAVPSGETRILKFDRPTHCLTSSCSFTITVDSRNEVKESNETNNTRSGVCRVLPG